MGQPVEVRVFSTAPYDFLTNEIITKFHHYPAPEPGVRALGVLDLFRSGHSQALAIGRFRVERGHSSTGPTEQSFELSHRCAGLGGSGGANFTHAMS